MKKIFLFSRGIKENLDKLYLSNLVKENQMQNNQIWYNLLENSVVIENNLINKILFICFNLKKQKFLVVVKNQYLMFTLKNH